MSDFWKDVKDVAAQERHRLALQGKKRVPCPDCSKARWRPLASADYDDCCAWYWAPTRRCSCNGWLVQVPCTVGEQIEAIDREIEMLQNRKAGLLPRAETE